MKRLILIATVVALVGGCGQPTQQEAKVQANARWQQARAAMLYGVALEHLRSGQLDQALTKTQETLVLEPEQVNARLLLARIYIEQGKYPLATAELQRLVEKAPPSADVQYLLGVAHERGGQYEPALAAYRKAQALSAGGVEAVVAQGEVLAQMGKLDEAAALVEAYKSQAGDDPAMFELGGRLAMLRKQPGRSADFYEQACALDPKNRSYAQALAEAQYAAGRHRDAMETLNRLIQDRRQPATGAMHLMLGDCCLALQRPTDARLAYIAARDMEPSSPLPHVGLAKAALAGGDSARAIHAARSALSLDGANRDAKVLLGYALIRESQAAAAAKLLQEAAAERPDDAVIQCLLARAYADCGQKEQARACLGRALELQPASELAGELLASMSQ